MAKAKTPKGFAKTGKSRPAQFGNTRGGGNEKTFKQRTEKTATAAMQGRPPQGGEVKAKPKNKGSKQFGKVPGKAVF